MKQDRGKLDDTLAAMFSNPTYNVDYLFYAHMIGMCSIKIMPELPAPAGVQFVVDHYNLIINPKEFDKFPLVERLAILKHEMLHILYGHVSTRNKGLKPLIWNYAADCALNQFINSDHLPDCAVMPDRLTEQLKMIGIEVTLPWRESSEFYYNALLQNLPEQPSEGFGDGDGESMDSHDTWAESTGDAELQEDLTKKMIEKAQEETVKSKGKIPGECNDWIKLHSRKSEVNWKKVLRGIVGNKRVGYRRTIMRSDRRFQNRDDLRGKTKERKFNLLVIADVSGSMSDNAVITTLAEIANICDITKSNVDLIQVDAQAYEPEKLTKKTKTIKRKGHGGTYLYPGIEKANERKIDYQAIIVLTDGGVFDDDLDHFSSLNKKVIWLVEKEGHILPAMETGRMQAFKLKS